MSRHDDEKASRFGNVGDDTLRRQDADDARGTRVSLRHGGIRSISFSSRKEARKAARKAAKARAKNERHTTATKVGFPRYSYYGPVFRFFTEQVLDAEYISLPPATRRTVELGDANSSDFVCSPFKRIVGDYIENLEHGANVLVQVTGCCRLTYYGELQEMILHDLGFEDFQMLNFSDVAGKGLKDYVKFCRDVVNPNISIKDNGPLLVGCLNMLLHVDEFMGYYYENAAFEVERGAFERERKAFFAAMDAATTNAEVEAIWDEHRPLLEAIELDKPANPIRVGIVGDYYTAADDDSNMNVTQRLIDMGVSVSHGVTITTRNIRYNEKNLRASIPEYVTNDMGPTSSLNIATAKRYAQEGYDGVIHLKSAACTPEIDVVPVLQRISSDYKMPVLVLSFDSQTSDTGLQTRLEAFYDMISMRKERA